MQEGRLQDGLSNDPVRKAASSLYIRSFSLWSSYSLDQSFPGGSEVKVSACNAGDLGSIAGSGRSPGEGNGTHSSILSWRIPWTEEPGGL